SIGTPNNLKIPYKSSRTVSHPTRVQSNQVFASASDAKSLNSLDSCWAILGEVYGRYANEKLDKLGMKLRRVRSNIDDWEAFSKTVEYVPDKISFESANPDLLKLLVAPLYGEDPGIGIRELIQNAVDSVREVEARCEKHPHLKNIKRRELKADVVVTLHYENDRPDRVVIKDRGMGMNLDVIKNYFLKAGASFRTSDAWKERFEDDQGKAILPRSGRFGVGALAAFLIGDQIEVQTRHIDEERGLSFTASLNTTEIELKWGDFPVGTRISVKISDDNDIDWNRFVEDWWDYYHDPIPSLRRETMPSGYVLESEFVLPNKENCWRTGWRLLECEPYQAIFWTYDEAPNLSCNGIEVTKRRDVEASQFHDFESGISGISFNFPKLSIIDYNGNLPLNLQRTSLSVDRLPFEETLVDSVFNDFFAKVLVALPNAPITKECLDFLDQFDSCSSPFIFLKDGAILRDVYIANKANVSSLLLTGECIPSDLFGCDGCANVQIKTTNTGVTANLTLFLHVFGEFRADHNLPKLLDKKRTEGRIMFIRHPALCDLSRNRHPSRKNLNENWVEFEFGKCDQDRKKEIWEWINREENPQLNVVVESYLKKDALTDPPSPLAEAWMNTFNNPLMPYDLNTRKEWYKDVYKKSENYILLHEEKLKTKKTAR
ncbi:MAG: ATP-binding protein, partial [Magnetococcales bacterium]|nr:ATP-binding protein [Magnetococcales bacterium]